MTLQIFSSMRKLLQVLKSWSKVIRVTNFILYLMVASRSRKEIRILMIGDTSIPNTRASKSGKLGNSTSKSEKLGRSLWNKSLTTIMDMARIFLQVIRLKTRKQQKPNLFSRLRPMVNGLKRCFVMLFWRVYHQMTIPE